MGVLLLMALVGAPFALVDIICILVERKARA